jgi:hypothetical protein
VLRGIPGLLGRWHWGFGLGDDCVTVQSEIILSIGVKLLG